MEQASLRPHGPHLSHANCPSLLSPIHWGYLQRLKILLSCVLSKVSLAAQVTAEQECRVRQFRGSLCFAQWRGDASPSALTQYPPVHFAKELMKEHGNAPSQTSNSSLKISIFYFYFSTSTPHLPFQLPSILLISTSTSY